MSGPAGQLDQSGAEFRQKFEDLQAAYAQLAQTAVGLAQKSFPLLQPGDFEGIEPAKFIEVAEATQANRESDRERIFAEMAAAKGIDVSALQQAPAQKPPADAAASRIASLGELKGNPPAGPDPTQGLEGRALLEAVYARQEAGSSK